MLPFFARTGTQLQVEKVVRKTGIQLQDCEGALRCFMNTRNMFGILALCMLFSENNSRHTFGRMT